MVWSDGSMRWVYRSWILWPRRGQTYYHIIIKATVWPYGWIFLFIAGEADINVQVVYLSDIWMAIIYQFPSSSSLQHHQIQFNFDISPVQHSVFYLNPVLPGLRPNILFTIRIIICHYCGLTVSHKSHGILLHLTD